MDALIPRTTLTEICAHRDASVARMALAVEYLAQGFKLAGEALDLAQPAHQGAILPEADRSSETAYKRLFKGIDPALSLETFRRHIDARVWMRVMAHTGLDALMDRTAKEKLLYGPLCGDVPVMCEDNVLTTLETVSGDAKLIFQRGLARAFIDLDRRFKSHDGFKLGARIILYGVFNEWGNWNYHSKMRDTIQDVERVFAVLDGNRPDPHSLFTAIDADRKGKFGPHQSCTEGTYFRIRAFKNGNAHLWFTREDLVEKANLVLADFYGKVLPDGVGPDVTDRDIREKSTAVCKDLSFYWTPDAVTGDALRDVRIGADSVVLEPSAGQGHIVSYLLAHRVGRVDAVEVDAGRVATLRGLAEQDARLNVTHANFLAMPARPVYTHVIMNPPFYGEHYMQHVMHAFDFLVNGGTLIAILPATAEYGESKAHEAFRTWMQKHSYFRGDYMFQSLPLEAFAAAGTRVSTCYIRLRK